MVETTLPAPEPSEFVSAYGAWRASALGQITDRLERTLLFELMGELRGRAVLDMGCGDGELAVAIAARGATVTGIDLSSAAIRAAAARASSRGVPARFEVADARHLPFASGAFDLVVAVTVLSFVRPPEAALREAARVLRPGGRLIVGELGRWSPWAARRRIRGWLGHPIWREARFWSASGLRSLVTGAGLLPGRVFGAVYYPPFGAAARLLAPLDPRLGRLTPFGAAFLALAVDKRRVT